MPVNLNQYRAAIGVFNNRNLITDNKFSYFTESNRVGINLFSAINVIVFFFFFFMFVVSVHQKNRKIRFTSILLPLLIMGFCLYHSVAAHNFIKIALLKAYLSAHKIDIVCLSETLLNSSVSIDDDNLQIPGYSSLRADHPSNTKRVGVLLYYKRFYQ